MAKTGLVKMESDEHTSRKAAGQSKFWWWSTMALELIN